MALDLWSHQFCLGCDKQVDTDAAAYCSESCRLAELERLSTPSSQASSPGLTPPSYPWNNNSTQSTITATQPSSSKFYLAPAYDFSKAEPYGVSSTQQAIFGNYKLEDKTNAARRSTLSPSSSHTSLCSIQSNSSMGDSSQLSDRAKQELRAYAVSFEHVRSQRRRSY